MTGAVVYFTETEAHCIIDSISADGKGRPARYAAKFSLFPHAHAVTFGIGMHWPAKAVEAAFDLELLTDVDDIIAKAPPVVRAAFNDWHRHDDGRFKTMAGNDGQLEFWALGWSRRDNCFKCGVIASHKDFRPVHLKPDSPVAGGVRIQAERPDRDLVMPDDLIAWSKLQKQADRALIGGDLFYVHMTAEAISITRPYRFPDTDDAIKRVKQWRNVIEAEAEEWA